MQDRGCFFFVGGWLAQLHSPRTRRDQLSFWKTLTCDFDIDWKSRFVGEVDDVFAMCKQKTPCSRKRWFRSNPLVFPPAIVLLPSTWLASLSSD